MPRKKLGRASGKPRTGKSRLQLKSRAALRRLTRKDLQALARREGLKGWSRLKKEELVRLLGSHRTSHEAGAGEEAPKVPHVAPLSSSLLAEEETALPEAYGETRLVLMPVDPFWVHAYWELPAQDAREIRARMGKGAGRARRILRVYDVTFIQFDGANAHSSFDIEITPSVRNWYINLWSPRKSLCAELGLVAPDGTFFPLTRSNVAHTPAAWISPNTGESWMKVAWRLEGALQSPSSSGLPSPMRRKEPRGKASTVPETRESRPTRQVPASFGTAEKSALAPELSELDLPGGIGQKRLIRPEEYQRFLEGTPRRNRSGKEETPSSALKPSAFEVAARSFESGLSSHGLIRNPSVCGDLQRAEECLAQFRKEERG